LKDETVASTAGREVNRREIKKLMIINCELELTRKAEKNLERLFEKETGNSVA
jgi:hypothetical protein